MKEDEFKDLCKNLKSPNLITDTIRQPMAHLEMTPQIIYGAQQPHLELSTSLEAKSAVANSSAAYLIGLEEDKDDVLKAAAPPV
jgi:hypothetical protein